MIGKLSSSAIAFAKPIVLPPPTAIDDRSLSNLNRHVHDCAGMNAGRPIGQELRRTLGKFALAWRAKDERPGDAESLHFTR
jgi:hypothetical protein